MPLESPRNSPPQTRFSLAHSIHESPAPQLLFPFPSLPSPVPSYPVRQRVSRVHKSFESLRFAQSSPVNSRRRGSIFPLSFPSCLRKSRRYPQRRRRHSRTLARSLSNPQTSPQSAGTSAGSCLLLLRHLDPATAGQAGRRHTETAPTSPARAPRPPLLPFAPQGLSRASPFVAGTPDSRSRSKCARAFPKLSIAPSPPSSPPKLLRKPTTSRTEGGKLFLSARQDSPMRLHGQ